MVTVETINSKKLILALVIVFLAFVTVLLVFYGQQIFGIVSIVTLIQLTLILGIIEVQIGFLLLLQYRTNKKNDYLILALITAFAILLIILLVYNEFISHVFDDHSLHLGWILGLIALILLTIGTILVLYDEPTFVLYHGLTNGSAWILTLLNVISLITLNNQLQISFSGVVHFVHIVMGAIGLASGFASLLLGISGQRRLSKLSGIITYACWWGAFFLGLFL